VKCMDGCASKILDDALFPGFTANTECNENLRKKVLPGDVCVTCFPKVVNGDCKTSVDAVCTTYYLVSTMVNCRISPDRKYCALDLWNRGWDTLDICDALSVSRATGTACTGGK
jgi:hypothetical protein